MKVLLGIYGDFEVRQYSVNGRFPIYYEDTEKFYEQCVENKDTGIWLVVEKRTGNNYWDD